MSQDWLCLRPRDGPAAVVVFHPRPACWQRACHPLASLFPPLLLPSLVLLYVIHPIGAVTRHTSALSLFDDITAATCVCISDHKLRLASCLSVSCCAGSVPNHGSSTAGDSACTPSAAGAFPPCQGQASSDTRLKQPDWLGQKRGRAACASHFCVTA